MMGIVSNLKKKFLYTFAQQKLNAILADGVERHEHFRKIRTTGHPQVTSQLPGVKSAPIIIEDDVWISFGVTILKGVRIGAGSVIAAGSIVVQDVPANTFYRCEVKPMMTPLDKESA